MNPSLNKALGATEVPTGWPVGSFTTYAEAQRAVDNLSDREFPVEKLSIVGVDLMQVEKITGRLTWPKVLGTGALSGLWMGLFFGLLLSLISVPGAGLTMFVWAVVIGAIFGTVASAVAYAFTGGCNHDRGWPLRRAVRARCRPAGPRHDRTSRWPHSRL